jgi:hypothetical protein
MAWSSSCFTSFSTGSMGKPWATRALGSIEGLEHAPGAVGEVGIVVEHHAVHLPHVEVIGPQPAQRLVQHAHREGGVAPVRAHLGHQQDLLPTSRRREGPPHPVLAATVVVLPAVVEEGDAAVDGFADDAVRLGEAGRVAEVVSADGEGRDLHAGLAQRAARDAGHSGSSAAGG